MPAIAQEPLVGRLLSGSEVGIDPVQVAGPFFRAVPVDKSAAFLLRGRGGLAALAAIMPG